MAACTLTLYERNIFRVMELPVDATAKAVKRQAQKQQMLAEMGGGESVVKPAFSLTETPDEDQIREALARMKTPEDRIVDEFFWFWPEKFGNSNSDPAIQAVLSGNPDKAAEIWAEGEVKGSFTAVHNLAIMFHLAAVDWTVHQLKSSASLERDEKIKGYWQQTFDRWEKVAEMEEIWDCMKDRVRSIDDEALTTGFIRRMRDELPMALDRVNAEAALAFAEKEDMTWAEYHVRLMNETHQGLDDVEATAELVLEPTRKRVRQYIDSAELKAGGSPKSGAKLAMELLQKCKRSMAIYDLFHGKEAYQRADLFDQVAACSTSLAINYQLETGDNAEFVNVLNFALDFASGISIREKIILNASIGEDNLASQKFEPIFASLRSVSESGQGPKSQLSMVRRDILPMLPTLTPAWDDSNVYNALLDSVAIALREISVAAHNDYDDFATANSAIKIALELAVATELKTRLQADAAQLTKNAYDTRCHFCGVWNCKPESSVEIAMYGDVQRFGGQVHFRTTTVRIPRCKTCKKKQDQTDNVGCGLALLPIAIGALVGETGKMNWFGGAFIGALLGVGLYLLCTTFGNIFSGYSKFSRHSSILTMKKKGWRIGSGPT